MINSEKLVWSFLYQKIIGCIQLEEKLTPFSWKNDCEIICLNHGIQVFSFVDKYQWKTYSKYCWDLKDAVFILHGSWSNGSNEAEKFQSAQARALG